VTTRRAFGALAQALWLPAGLGCASRSPESGLDSRLGRANFGGMLWRMRPAGFIEPCLPSTCSLPPSGDRWLHEIKYDGYRMLARRDGAGGGADEREVFQGLGEIEMD
jgi:hypothetical protein